MNVILETFKAREVENRRKDEDPDGKVPSKYQYLAPYATANGHSESPNREMLGSASSEASKGSRPLCVYPVMY